MKYENKNNKKTIGYKGEQVVLDKLKTIGFILYKKNIKYIDFEIDLILYRYSKNKNTLDIRIVEVKTRGVHVFDLSTLGLYKKWNKVRKYMFNIKEEIDKSFSELRYSEIHFDLALVKYNTDSYFVYSYIRDINLMI